MSAFSRGTYIIECNSKVKNSSITESTIDMDGGVITNHGIPINGTDVVNKDYVDSATGTGIPTVTITLSGTSFVTILSEQKGDIFISVKNIITNGPSASFQLSKSEASKQSSYVRMSSSAGLNTQEKLDIRWSPNSGIELKKTGVNYDGDYKVKYILND